MVLIAGSGWDSLCLGFLRCSLRSTLRLLHRCLCALSDGAVDAGTIDLVFRVLCGVHTIKHVSNFIAVVSRYFTCQELLSVCINPSPKRTRGRNELIQLLFVYALNTFSRCHSQQ